MLQLKKQLLILKSLLIEFVSLFLSLTFFCVWLLLLIAVFLGILSSDIINKNITSPNSLYKVGIISTIAIAIHNLPEGIITFITTTKNTNLGLSLAIAIAIHNIPEGLSISIPVYYATKKRSKAIQYTLIASLSEPLGAILTYLFLLKIINNLILGILLSLISGIMISISLTELLPKALSYKENDLVKKCFIIGIITILLKIFIH